MGSNKRNYLNRVCKKATHLMLYLSFCLERIRITTNTYNSRLDNRKHNDTNTTYRCTELTKEISGLSVWLLKDEECGNNRLEFTAKLEHGSGIHMPMDKILHINYLNVCYLVGLQTDISL